jgi:deoxyribodipyrimidine photo-lyase
MNIFIFRRDFRLKDNLGWAAAAAQEGPTLPVFIFNEDQVNPDRNPYFSKNSMQFMLESLNDLNDQLRGKLATYHAKDDLAVLEKIRRTNGIKAVTFNADVTPYATRRDARIAEWCAARKIPCQAVRGDYTLLPPGSVETKSGTPYQKFTPFMRAMRKALPAGSLASARSPAAVVAGGEGDITLARAWKRWVGARNQRVYVDGGRKAALVRLARPSLGKSYESRRNDVWDATSTTMIGAYLKFGCISVREAYDRFRTDPALVDQLLWREFYANIAWSFPRVLGGQTSKKENENFVEKNIRWKKPALLDAWQEGRTGVPLVDAGMRQLNATGYMHNRARMVTASYLTKDLGIDWRHGERYFASRLVDYDPSSNNGNWQWVAGTGTDSQPYQRKFNPFVQAKRFDPRCTYVREWVPELRKASDDVILNWDAAHSTAGQLGYPAPVHLA